MAHFNSFKEYQDYLLKIWLPTYASPSINPALRAVQLDGSTILKPNQKVVDSFQLTDVEELKSLTICFHGDMKLRAIEEIAKNDLNKFILVPPQLNRKHWRFHFQAIHNYDRHESSDGMYAYVK